AAKAYLAYGGLSVEIPALGVQTDIVGVPLGPDGWDVTWLGDQAGYLAGTAFPTWTGNSVITGHVTLPSGGAGPFARLQELRFGDRIVVEAWGMRYIYEVREQKLVRPDAPSIFRHEDLAWVTLVTCAGFDERTETYLWRSLVRAVLVGVELSE
ncbi:MAG TPA: class F sortase, partial [Anaerolineales bacterium]